MHSRNSHVCVQILTLFTKCTHSAFTLTSIRLATHFSQESIEERVPCSYPFTSTKTTGKHVKRKTKLKVDEQMNLRISSALIPPYASKKQNLRNTWSQDNLPYVTSDYLWCVDRYVANYQANVIDGEECVRQVRRLWCPYTWSLMSQITHTHIRLVTRLMQKKKKKYIH